MVRPYDGDFHDDSEYTIDDSMLMSLEEVSDYQQSDAECIRDMMRAFGDTFSSDWSE